jgi:hypothetical protein
LTQARQAVYKEEPSPRRMKWRRSRHAARPSEMQARPHPAT